jgi:SAM-dependent methyltransferase
MPAIAWDGATHIQRREPIRPSGAPEVSLLANLPGGSVMAVTPKAFELLKESIRYMPRPARMFELGNQMFHDFYGVKITDETTYMVVKDWVESLGIEHVSVDLNGRDGALKRDVCGDLSDLGQFDVVTNFGSSEHVKNQEACFRSFHNVCRTGGEMLHLVPMVGYWPGHCEHRYTKEFFEKLSEANRYHVYSLEINEECGDTMHHIAARIAKVDDSPFVWTGGVACGT